MSMTKTIIGTAVVAGLLMAAPLAFADNATTTERGSARPTAADIAAKITCVGTAVAAREAALGTATTAHGTAVNAAYAARASALSAAYTQTTAKAVGTAVRSAWGTFRSSLKSAQKDWITAKNSAWKTYRTAARACKAPENVSDGGNSGSEANGN